MQNAKKQAREYNRSYAVYTYWKILNGSDKKRRRMK